MGLLRKCLVVMATWALWLPLFGGLSAAASQKLIDTLCAKNILSAQECRDLRAEEAAEKARLEEQIKKSQPPFDISYKDGFRITSKDKQHELRFGVQVFNQVSIFPSNSASDNFLLRRGRVTFRGHVFNDFTYRLELDGADADNVLDQDAYLGWEKYKQFRVRVGQHKARFGGEQTWSRYDQFFLERSMISDNLTEGSARGVFIYSDPVPGVPVQVEFSVTNGTGRASDNNSSKDFALRVIGRPFQGTPWAAMLPIEVAGNFAIGDQPLNANGARTRLFLRDNRLVIFNTATQGLQRRYGGDIWYNKDYENKGGPPVSAMFEFIYERQERQGSTFAPGLADIIRYGYILQGGYLVTGSRSKNGVELVAKVEGIDMDDDANNGGAGDLAGQKLRTYAFGLNYWPIKEVRLTVDGFVFDFDQPITTAADPNPFNNGGTAWAVVAGAYFKY